MIVSEFYQQQLEQKKIIRQQAEREVRLFTLLRFLSFCAGAIAIFAFWGAYFYVILSFIAFIIIFLFQVSKSVDAKLKLEKIRLQLDLIEQEIDAVNSKKTSFDPGSEFISSNHDFGTDIDLFSPRGIFSFFNRTSSKSGKLALAKLFLNGSNDTQWVNKQIEFLSTQIDWTLQFRVSGSIASRSSAYDKKIADFVDINFKNPSYLKLFSWLIPILSIGSLIAFNLDLLNETIFALVLIFAMGIISGQLKNTNSWAATLAIYEARVVTAHEQLQLIQKLNGKLSIGDQIDIQVLAQELKNWLNIQKRFDIRMNILVSIPLNIFVAWDFHQRIALEKWCNKNAALMKDWEHQLAQLEAIISAATVRFNYRQETVYAELNSSITELNFQHLAHPLIQVEKSITNDFKLSSETDFIILTGPNMAGKSTFLRSIGVGIMCANAGFPIFASSFILPNLKLFTSMRTSDDLSLESSYFHAELSRLRLLKNAVEPNKQLFVLLDEILKGTNSKDKEEGSKKFLLKLKSLGIKGIIATHDLSLCVLSQENQAFKNYYFDSTISKDELSFDYKLKEGICKNMNASFLLKKMELID